MEYGFDLLGRLARVGYNTLSSKYCCENGPTFMSLSHYSALCVTEFDLSLQQHQTLTNLMVDMHKEAEAW